MSENIEEKYKYTKIFLETIINNAFDKICSRDDGEELYIDPNSKKSEELIDSEKQAVKLTYKQLEKIVSQKMEFFCVQKEVKIFIDLIWLLVILNNLKKS